MKIIKKHDKNTKDVAVETDENQLEDVVETEVNMSQTQSPGQELEEQKKLYDDLLDKLQRNMAEFDNFRKRTAKEKTSMYDDGVRDTIEKLLPIIDNFERALASVENKSDGFYKGIEMIYRQLTVLFYDIGVEDLPSVGESFDPNIHFAVAHVEDPAYKENEIIDELQKGYKYKEKVIRHSMVRVAN